MKYGTTSGVEHIISATQQGDIQAGVDYFIALPHDKRKQFIEDIGAVKSEATARLLTALYPAAEQKDLRKLIKKLLFHLKTQGIRSEERVAEGEPVLKKVEAVREQIAFGSNYDHEGIRILLLAFQIKKKQFIFTHATQRFGEGLVDVMSAPIDKQGLDSLIGDYRSRARSPMILVEISPPYASYLIEEASKQSGRQVEEIRGLKRLAARLTGDVRQPSDIYGLQVPVSTPDVSWRQILSEGVFEPLALSWRDMDEDKKEFDSVVNPQIVLPPHVVEEKKMAFLKGLAASEKMQPLRVHLSRLLEDYAYYFHCKDEYANYSALINALRSGDTFDYLMQFFLGKSLEKKQEEEKQTPGLIVNPYTRKP